MRPLPTHANVFAKFLEFCGLVFSEISDLHAANFAKLSLITLLTITEANDLNKLLHDPNNHIASIPSVLQQHRVCAIGRNASSSLDEY
jgi:hypothetical protein